MDTEQYYKDKRVKAEKETAEIEKIELEKIERGEIKDMKDNFFEGYELPIRQKQQYGNPWFNDDGKIWIKLGKPLHYRKGQYRADDEISCSYCDKPLAMYHGSPDLSATDVCCFECYKERAGGQVSGQ